MGGAEREQAGVSSGLRARYDRVTPGERGRGPVGAAISLNRRYLEFAKFEIRCKELERARAILKWALENLKGPKDALTAEYTLFEKQYGTMENIETILLAKRKDQYEAIVKETPYDYDAWFDYLKMLEQQGRPSDVIEAYERAVSNVPPSQEKRFWRRYEREKSVK